MRSINSVRKVRLFDDDYRRIFNRTIDAHRLYLIELIVEAVFAGKARLRPEIASSFASVRLTVAHLLSQVLRMSEKGTELLEHPDRWLPELREAVLEKLKGLVDEVVDSVNAHIQEEEADQATETQLVYLRVNGQLTCGWQARFSAQLPSRTSTSTTHCRCPSASTRHEGEVLAVDAVRSRFGREVELLDLRHGKSGLRGSRPRDADGQGEARSGSISAMSAEG